MIFTINCIHCFSPIDYNLDEIIHVIQFPNDEEHIVSALTQKLNSSRCSVCKKNNTLITVTPLLIYDVGRRQIILSQKEENLIEHLKEALSEIKNKYGSEISIKTVENAPAVIDELGFWTQEYMDQHFRDMTAVSNNRTAKNVDAKAFIISVPRLMLRMLRLHFDGKLFIQYRDFDPNDPVGRKETWEFYTNIVLSKIGFLAQEAARDNDLYSLPDRFAAELPVEALTDEILELYATAVSGNVGRDIDLANLQMQWLNLYSNAVLHRYAGRRDPLVYFWARLFITVEYLKQKPDQPVDSGYLIPGPQAKSTLPFFVLWNQMAEEMHDKDRKWQNKMEGFFFDLFDRIGYQDELNKVTREGWLTISFHIAPEGEQRQDDIRKLVDTSWRNAEAEAAINNDNAVESARYMSRSLFTATQYWFKADLSEACFLLASKACEELISSSRPIHLCQTASRLIEQFNNYHFFSQSFEIMKTTYWTIQDARESLPVRYLLGYLNECGNVHRHLFELEKALEFYRYCEDKLLHEVEEEVRADTYNMLLRNKAIVYRGLGQYAKAISIFEEIKEFYSEDSEFFHNLSVTYGLLNMLEEALSNINRSIELTIEPVYFHRHINYLITRSYFLCKRKDFEKAAEDFHRIIFLPEVTREPRERAACAVLMMITPTPSRETLCDKARDIAQAMLQGEAHSLDHTEMAFKSLTRYYLRLDKFSEANETFVRFIAWLERPPEEINDWSIQHLYAIVSFADENHFASWQALQKAMGLIYEELISNDAKPYADRLQFDKEEFKKDLASLGMKLFDKGIIGAEEIISIYQFNNSLEIAVRLQSNVESILSVRDCLQQLEPGIACLFFLDYDDKVAVIGWDNTLGAFLLEGLMFSQPDILQLGVHISEELRDANPNNLDRLEKEFFPLFELLQPLAEKAHSFWGKADGICFFPGATFANFPLHLMCMEDRRYLIKEVPLFYSPSLPILLHTQQEKERKMAVLCVPKWTDDVEFHEALTKFVADMEAMHKEHGLKVVKNHDGTRRALSTLLEEFDELTILCHGAYAGDILGNAICISDNNVLPTGYFPVEENPIVRRYLYTWQDIAKLSRTPSVVVSLACSSGRVKPHVSGVQYGLSQALFSLGTSTMISPLWDIQESTSLEFIKILYEIRAELPQLTFLQHYHATIKTAKERYPSYYYWGALVFTGNHKLH